MEEYREGKRTEKNGKNHTSTKTSITSENPYNSNFQGYSKNIPKEVIVQLLMRANDPMSLISQVCNTFELSKEDAIRLAEKAIKLKEK
jgi:hypothetical protein